MSEADRLMAEFDVLHREVEADMRALITKVQQFVVLADALTEAALNECQPSAEERESVLAMQARVHAMAAKLGA